MEMCNIAAAAGRHADVRVREAQLALILRRPRLQDMHGTVTLGVKAGTTPVQRPKHEVLGVHMPGQQVDARVRETQLPSSCGTCAWDAQQQAGLKPAPL